VNGADIPDLTLSEWAVLGLVAEGTTHGFAIAEQLAPDGELGGIWTVKRSLVYRSVKQLAGRGLVAELDTERVGRGPARTPLACTGAGTHALDQWLVTPVQRVRNFRSELLLKLAFQSRRGTSARSLLEAQLEQLRPLREALVASRRRTDGIERLALDWRAENTRAAERFVKRQLEAADR
jgi:DNA-binding PadR family transcriptional regulator